MVHGQKTSKFSKRILLHEVSKVTGSMMNRIWKEGRKQGRKERIVLIFQDRNTL
jgi:hypothetical protein